MNVAKFDALGGSRDAPPSSKYGTWYTVLTRISAAFRTKNKRRGPDAALIRGIQ